jgi:hypothetical protein
MQSTLRCDIGFPSWKGTLSSSEVPIIERATVRRDGQVFRIVASGAPSFCLFGTASPEFRIELDPRIGPK